MCASIQCLTVSLQLALDTSVLGIIPTDNA